MLIMNRATVAMIQSFKHPTRSAKWPFTATHRFFSPTLARPSEQQPPLPPAQGQEEEEKPWEDPFKHAVPSQKETHTNFIEAKVDWNYVERLLPMRTIPDMPKVSGVTPSGWKPPQDPAPDLPYYIRRRADHTHLLYLESRRDELNPKTMDFEHVELVTLKGIKGDIFECEKDLRKFLEKRVGHPVATHVDELKGYIKVKGAQQAEVERFVYDSGF